MTRKPKKPTDIVTLADLAPRQPVVGGSGRHVFGATPHAGTERTMATTRTAKDLPAKKTVKSGRLGANDNLTLVGSRRPRRIN